LNGLEMPPEPTQDGEEDRALVASARAAIAEIERLQGELSKDRSDTEIYKGSASLIIDLYCRRIEVRATDGEAAALARESETIDRRMRLAAIKAERTAIFRMLRARKIGSQTARKLVRELDLLEARYEA
jgi:CPA1 family monovalent cation:H+ antiporter